MKARQRGAHVNLSQPHSLQGYEHVEEENVEAEKELRTKVGALKSLTIDIGCTIRDHNQYLKQVDDDFDSTFGQLLNNVQRVVKLAKSGNRWHLLSLFLFSVFVFFIIWWRIE